MVKVQVYSAKGTKTGTSEFPKQFIEKENLNLLAQAIHIYQDRQHLGTHKVKTRGEVNASTIKIYRQKGTGRARHGAISAPIFVGGGIAHGPKGVKRRLSLPQKMRQKAMKIMLSMLLSDNRVAIATNLDSIKKTKVANNFLTSISKEKFEGKSPKTLVVLAKEEDFAKRAFKNIRNVTVSSLEDLNAYVLYF